MWFLTCFQLTTIIIICFSCWTPSKKPSKKKKKELIDPYNHRSLEMSNESVYRATMPAPVTHGSDDRPKEKTYLTDDCTPTMKTTANVQQFGSSELLDESPKIVHIKSNSIHQLTNKTENGISHTKLGSAEHKFLKSLPERNLKQATTYLRKIKRFLEQRQSREPIAYDGPQAISFDEDGDAVVEHFDSKALKNEKKSTSCIKTVSEFENLVTEKTQISSTNTSLRLLEKSARLPIETYNV